MLASAVETLYFDQLKAHLQTEEEKNEFEID